MIHNGISVSRIKVEMESDRTDRGLRMTGGNPCGAAASRLKMDMQSAFAAAELREAGGVLMPRRVAVGATGARRRRSRGASSSSSRGGRSCRGSSERFYLSQRALACFSKA